MVVSHERRLLTPRLTLVLTIDFSVRRKDAGFGATPQYSACTMSGSGTLDGEPRSQYFAVVFSSVPFFPVLVPESMTAHPCLL
jgi:hypothetical protein